MAWMHGVAIALEDGLGVPIEALIVEAVTLMETSHDEIEAFKVEVR